MNRIRSYLMVGCSVICLMFSLLLLEKRALAYIPPSQFIIKNIVNKRKDIKVVKVRSVVSTVEGDRAGATRFTAITLFSLPTSAVKAWAVGENSVRLYGIQRRGSTLPSVVSLLFESRLSDLIRSLREVGIPVRTEDELRAMKDEDERRGAEVQHLERWKGGTAWVIGRRTPPEVHELTPQLWVEKDTFYPLRMIFPVKQGQEQGEMVDIRFEGTRNFRGFNYPRVVTAFGKDGVPWLRDEVIDVSVNPKSDEIEDAVEGGYTDAASSIDSSLKDLIEKYFGAVR